jgi:hypothetical protein
VFDMAGGCNYTSALDPEDLCEDFAMYMYKSDCV